MQAAIFVDAGYVFAQGSSLLFGDKTPRDQLELVPAAAVLALQDALSRISPSSRLLRVYWYDGLLREALPTPAQRDVERAENVKVRYGRVNSRGQQKEVDSLIVTDLIELARNRAIDDAILLSGDGDLRIGVQIAQTFGVRVHTIGMKPLTGSVSPELLAEVDTRTEWQTETVESLLRLLCKPSSLEATTLSLSPEQIDHSSSIDDSIKAVLAKHHSDLDEVSRYIQENRGAIPAEVDRPALGELRKKLGRDLSDVERKDYRKRLGAAITEAVAEATDR